MTPDAPPSCEPDWTIAPPLPESVRTLLLFGGAFDPPHRSHVELPVFVRDAIGADWLLYIPAARTPLKTTGPIATADDRLSMLKLALPGQARTSVTDVEIRRGGVSYTLDTLRQLRERLGPRITFRLLIGADQAASFHRWREPERVIELAEPVVMLRSPHESEEELMARLGEHWPPRELERWKSRIIQAPTSDASSTEVRRVLATEGPDSPTLETLTPAPVRDYIAARHLYESSKEPE